MDLLPTNDSVIQCINHLENIGLSNYVDLQNTDPFIKNIFKSQLLIPPSLYIRKVEELES